ncbi:MAG: hypothetical protein GXY77_17560 [Fibrobacter sp.]|nr:hypothetical protein [Fibrobacter sp.]
MYSKLIPSIFIVFTLLSFTFGGEPLQSWISEVQTSQYLSIGRSKIDMNSMNKTVNSLGIPSLTEMPYTVEIGSRVLVQQLVLESGVGVLMWKPQKSDSSSVSLFGGYGLLTAGVNFFYPGKSWQLYPFFNIGGMLFRFAYHTQENVLFGETIGEGDKPEVYWQPAFITGFGSTVMYSLHSKKRQKLYTVGLKVGYMADPSGQNTWYANGMRYKNGPSPHFSGPYVHLLLGTGRYIK